MTKAIPLARWSCPEAYQARLTVTGKTSTAPIEVKMDPRLKTSAEDLQKQFDLMLKLRDRQEEMNRAILAIRDLRVQLNVVEKRWGTKDNAKAVIEQSVALRKKIGAIEDELIQVNSKASEDELNYPTKMNSWLGYLQGAVDSADAQPTEGELAVFADLNQETGRATCQMARSAFDRRAGDQRGHAQKRHRLHFRRALRPSLNRAVVFGKFLFQFSA